MIIFRQVDAAYFDKYDMIPMRLTVTSEFRIIKHDLGLSGFTITEVPVEPYLKDFCVGDDVTVSSWAKRFDITNWAFFMAFDGDAPIGAATVASRTDGVNMLGGRDDLAVLWDIRVHDDYKHHGIGQRLFDMAVAWSRSQGLVQLKIECQNNNVPAVKFYHKQGAVLCSIDEYAYYTEPEYRNEIRFLWYLDL